MFRLFLAWPLGVNLGPRAKCPGSPTHLSAAFFGGLLLTYSIIYVILSSALNKHFRVGNTKGSKLSRLFTEVMYV